MVRCGEARLCLCIYIIDDVQTLANGRLFSIRLEVTGRRSLVSVPSAVGAPCTLTQSSAAAGAHNGAMDTQRQRVGVANCPAVQVGGRAAPLEPPVSPTVPMHANKC